MEARTKTKPFPSADELVNMTNMEDEIADLTAGVKPEVYSTKPGGIIEVKSSSQVIPEDPINPSHYRKHPSGIECIEVVRHMTFNLGQVFKYLWRADHKGHTIEDLKKAQWYLDDEIRRLGGK